LIGLLIVLIVAALFIGFAAASFFVRRHGESDAPGAGWTRTTEAFRDPSSGRLMRVWVDQAGTRHYVPEADLPPER
jgi:hypothetical protein